MLTTSIVRSGMPNSENHKDDLRLRIQNWRDRGWLEKANKMERILNISDDLNLSMSAFCLKAGLNVNTLNRLFEVDNPSLPRMDTLNKLAIAAGYANYDSLLLGESWHNTKIKVITIPIMADVPGGAWSEAFDHSTEKATFIVDRDGDYSAIRIIGNSINRIASDGMAVAIDKSQNDPSYLADQPVVAECNGEVTAKIYRRNPERLEPYSTDPGFSVIYPHGEWRIIGKIVAVEKKIPSRIP